MQSLTPDKPWPLTRKRQHSATHSNCQHPVYAPTCCLPACLSAADLHCSLNRCESNFTNWQGLLKRRQFFFSSSSFFMHLITATSPEIISWALSVIFHMPQDRKWILRVFVLKVNLQNSPGKKNKCSPVFEKKYYFWLFFQHQREAFGNVVF